MRRIDINKNERTETFNNELELIKDENIRQFVSHALALCPEYFFEIAASSTGRYHPQTSLGVGGLVRHTKVACKFADDLSRVEMFNITGKALDLALAAIILHDTYKSGWPKRKYTDYNHPNLAADWIIELGTRYDFEFVDNEIEVIAGAVRSHMGQWNKASWNSDKEIMPKPKTGIDKFVHLCDYLASRKGVEVKVT